MYRKSPCFEDGGRVEQARRRLFLEEISQFLKETPSGRIMNKMMAQDSGRLVRIGNP